MRKLKIHSIFKILFIVVCTIFMLSACGTDKDGMNPINQSDDPAAVSGALNGKVENTNCWQAWLIGLFYDALGSTTSNAYSQLTANKGALNIIILAFCIWMAFQILSHVSSTVPESPGEFWTKVIRKAFLCTFCGYLASSNDQVIYAINTFVFPIYMTLLKFSASILDIMSKDPDASAPGIIIKGGGETICEPLANSLKDAKCISIQNKIDFSASSFPTAPADMMKCMVCAISDRLNIGFTIAFNLLKMTIITGVIVGGFLVVAFMIAKFGFALYLVDSIFRLCMMILIMPFLIIFFPFEQTRKWTAIGFKTILNSAAIMLCLSIILSMSALAMQKMLLDPQMNMNFADPREYANFGVVPLSLIFMGFIMIKSGGMAVQLSDKVTDGGGEANFQKKAAQVVGYIAKGAFVLITMGAGSTVTAVIEHSERLRAIKEKYDKMKEKYNKMKEKMNKAAGRSGGSGGGGSGGGGGEDDGGEEGGEE